MPFKTFFKVCGNVEALGAWDLDKAPAMEWSEGHVWSLDLPVPAGVDLEYKLVKIPRREPIAWEGGPNRLLKVRSQPCLRPTRFRPPPPAGLLPASSAPFPCRCPRMHRSRTPSWS